MTLPVVCSHFGVKGGGKAQRRHEEAGQKQGGHRMGHEGVDSPPPSRGRVRAGQAGARKKGEDRRVGRPGKARRRKDEGTARKRRKKGLGGTREYDSVPSR